MEKAPTVYSYARFSSLIQGKGYSLERQIKNAKKWAEDNGYHLDDQLVMTDEGKSAYSGEHLKGGALGQFLNDIRSGRVEPGSILVVEALDRISRENLMAAQGTVHEILRSGVEICTISDNQRYTKDMGLGAAVMILVALEAAHKESANKAIRSTESWNKRQLNAANGLVISKRCPAWLKVKNGVFYQIPERVRLVQQMFQWAKEGLGTLQISRKLTVMGEKTWGGGKEWNPGTIYGWLTSRKVLGEFRIKRIGKDLEWIPGYFPPIIDEGLFHIVQAEFKKRTTNHGSPRAGKTGLYQNLIPSLCTCGYCGRSMTFRDLGPAKGDLRYRLICSDAIKGVGCRYRAIVYLKAEAAILRYCLELDLNAVLQINGKDVELETARGKLEEIVGKIETAEAIRDATVRMIGVLNTQENIEMLAKRLDEVAIEKRSLVVERQEMQREVDRLSRTGSAIMGHLEAVRLLAGIMDIADKNERLDIRRKLRYSMKQAISEVVFFPVGLENRIAEATDDGIVVKEGPPTGLMKRNPQWMASQWPLWVEENSGRTAAAFLVRLRNNHCRLFRWNTASNEFQQAMVDADGFVEYSGQFRIKKGPGGFMAASQLP